MRNFLHNENCLNENFIISKNSLQRNKNQLIDKFNDGHFV